MHTASLAASHQLHSDEHSNYNCCSILVTVQETFDMLSEAERPGSPVCNFARCKFEALKAGGGATVCCIRPVW